MFKTAERVTTSEISDNYIFQRCLYAYKITKEHLYGDVLELGCGEGYAIEELAKKCNKYIAVDKYRSDIFNTLNTNIEFIKMDIPPLKYIAFNSYDFVLCFQLIEHIKKDVAFIQDIHRVLKPGGKLILTTPNKPMSLTNNPWHIREYTLTTLQELLCSEFDTVEIYGIYGNEKVINYYHRNKELIEKIIRFDLLNLRNNLPKPILKIIYDLFNRISRKSLLKKNRVNTIGITYQDFNTNTCANSALDLLAIATKKV